MRVISATKITWTNEYEGHFDFVVEFDGVKLDCQGRVDKGDPSVVSSSDDFWVVASAEGLRNGDPKLAAWLLRDALLLAEKAET